MSAITDPTAPLLPSGNLRRRMIVSRIAQGGATAAAVLAVAALGIVLYAIVTRGASQLSFGFVTKDLPLSGSGGGVGPAIVGTAELAGLGAAIAMPLGILTALFTTEFAGARSARAIRLVLDLMNGIPSIVIAVFVFGVLVAGNQQSAFACSVALAIIMLPVIARASIEVLARVPPTLREAADALGVSHWRTVIGVILPTSMGGILTATILAVARAAGETAPILVLCSIVDNRLHGNPFHTVNSIPLLIFSSSEGADSSGFARAWGSAFVLMAFILIANIGARALLRRSQKRLGQ
jgi:phosphate transport system permease protein